MPRLATLQLELTILDEGEQGKRWNGDPLASHEAVAAFRSAVEALQNNFRSLGLLVHTGYGVTASDVSD